MTPSRLDEAGLLVSVERALLQDRANRQSGFQFVALSITIAAVPRSTASLRCCQDSQLSGQLCSDLVVNLENGP